MTEHQGIVYDFKTDGAAYLRALERHETIEITEATFDYFMDVLPPIYMNRRMLIDGLERKVTFGFAEGTERIVAFWKTTVAGHRRYFCKRTSEINGG